MVWAPYDEAMDLLTYPHDRETLKEALELRKKTRALVVLRHGQARARASRGGADDRLRPLLKSGHLQAAAPGPAAGGVRLHPDRLVPQHPLRPDRPARSPTRRAGSSSENAGLSEEEATAKSVLKAVDDLLLGSENSVLCTHRPVLPAVFDAIGIPDPAPGAGRPSRRAPPQGQSHRHGTSCATLSKGPARLFT